MLQTCISDYCYCHNENRAQCACDGITVFAKDCQFRGIMLHDEWRDTETCRKFNLVSCTVEGIKSF